MYCFLNGKFLNESMASVSVNNRSFRYGDGCFETMKLAAGKLALAQLHMDRLFDAMQRLQFTPPHWLTAQYLVEKIEELAKKNSQETLSRVRLTVYRGDGGLYDPENDSPNVLIQCWPLTAQSNSLNENGLVLGDYTEGFKAADQLANIKSNNFLLYAMAAKYAQHNKWNDALVLNHKGYYADATIANLWIIKDHTIITPPLSDGPVSGVMRRYLLQQLPTLGFTISEQSIQPQDLATADEFFLSNAIAGIKWVKQHGEIEFSTRHAADIYHQLVLPLWR